MIVVGVERLDVGLKWMEKLASATVGETSRGGRASAKTRTMGLSVDVLVMDGDEVMRSVLVMIKDKVGVCVVGLIDCVVDELVTSASMTSISD